MSARYYAFTGAFTTAGTSPDGDTIRFRPDFSKNLRALAGWASLSKQGSKQSAVSVRLEGVDAPELHYEGARQRRSAGARTRLLRRLGFSRFELLHDWVMRAAETRGVIIARAADVRGRVIRFVYRLGDVAIARDAMVALDRAIVAASANAHMLATGAAYPLAYASLEADVRRQLRGLARDARGAHHGVWSDDATRAFALSGVASVGARGALVFPKLFRRCVTACGEGARDGGEFLEWLRGSREHDDEIRVNGRSVRMSALLAVRGGRLRIEVDPTALVFVPRG